MPTDGDFQRSPNCWEPSLERATQNPKSGRWKLSKPPAIAVWTISFSRSSTARLVTICIDDLLRDGVIELTFPQNSYGPAHAFWLICRVGDAGMLRTGRSQPMVCLRFCCGMCVGVGLRVSSGCLAVRTGRGDLVSRCAAPVVDESRFKITRIEAADRPLALASSTRSQHKPLPRPMNRETQSIPPQPRPQRPISDQQQGALRRTLTS